MNLRIPAACAAVLFLAACGSSGTANPKVTHPNGNVSGTETLTGTLDGFSLAKNYKPVLPITATGVISDKGTLPLGSSKAGNGTFKLGKGKLVVFHSQGTDTKFKVVSASPCRGGQTTTGTYKVLPDGTGPYKGASGHGSYKVVFSAGFPLDHGKCTANNKPSAKSGKIVFTATGTFTEKK